MEEKLVEFANLLRENGVRVSLAETLDAFSASELTGLGERDVFRAALRSTMVKRASELPVFEELFDVYFSGLGEIIKQTDPEMISVSEKAKIVLLAYAGAIELRYSHAVPDTDSNDKVGN